MSPSATASRETHAPPLHRARRAQPGRRRALRDVPAHDRQSRLVDARRPAGRGMLPQRQADRPAGPGTVIPIPYDFDYSGLGRSALCDAARPARHSSTCSQRFYRGYCSHNAYALARRAADARGAAADARGLVADPRARSADQQRRRRLTSTASSRTSPPMRRRRQDPQALPAPARPSSSFPARGGAALSVPS